MPRNVLLLLALTATLQVNGQQSPFIHVDQFGYHTASWKIAVLSDPVEGFNSGLSFVPGTMLEIRDFVSDSIVMTVSPSQWKEGAVHDQSGDRGWHLDFTHLVKPGRYTIYDASTGERSAPFSISDNPYRDVLTAAGRMFFYNRCGAAKSILHAGPGWSDGVSFKQDEYTRSLEHPFDPALYKDLRGGWFDAGDYNKYVTFANAPVHDLLWTWQENPQACGDDWNIPESGNGIPDMLDEVFWELDWIYRMTNPDGSTHIKMGSILWEENSNYPPSNNFDTRYYGPVCSSAAIAAAGMLAHGAWVFKQIDGKASTAMAWMERAIACFAWATERIDNGNADTACDDGTIKAGDADWELETQQQMAIAAAAYLYRLNGDSVYHSYFLEHYASVGPVATGWWDCYQMQITDALLMYNTLPGRDSLTGALINQSFQQATFNNWGQFFGFTDEDLYLSHMPEWSYHWGSNQPKANYAILNLLADKYQIAPYDSLAFRYKAANQLHYFHGLNPLGLVYLSNMYSLGATTCVDELYHLWFYDGSPWDHAQLSIYGPPPGYIVGGPNQYFSVPELSPPYNEPMQKAYLDYNTGWPLNSWELSEPAIYYQAAYLRLLAWYVHSDLASGITDTQKPIPAIELFPNPVASGNEIFRTEGSIHAGKIIDLSGRNVGIWPLGQQALKTTDMYPGIYTVVWPDGVGRFIIQP